MPPWFHRLVKLAGPASDWKPVKIMNRPTTISATMATILISANQNSVSPNAFTVVQVQRAAGWRTVARRRDPQRQARPEFLGVAGDGDDVRDAGDHPAEPVGPAGEEAGPRAQEVGGEVAEGLVVQVGQQQLAHGPHDEEQHEADDHVDEDDGRAGRRDGLARAHEQAGADGAADGDQLDVPVAELPLKVGGSCVGSYGFSCHVLLLESMLVWSAAGVGA